MKNTIVFILCCTGLASLGFGADKQGTSSQNESPSFVAPSPLPTENHSDPSLMPPVRHDESPAETQPLNYDSESVEHPLGRGTPGLALLLGASYEQTKVGWDGFATLGARYYFPRENMDTDGPEALSPWSVEAGAVLPHKVSGNSQPIFDGFQYDAVIHKYTSEHLAVQYRFPIRFPIRMYPEVSLGVAFAQFADDINTQNAGLDYETFYVHSIGPLARIGLPILANDWFAIRMDMGYVHFDNKPEAQGHAIDLSVSGLGFYPSIQIGLGYLHSEVEKGVYIPDTAIPVWAIAALQTEKRSPIIAPPEVALNAHQAAQGGLSGNVLFQYKNSGAQKVELMGDFNHWQPEAMAMDKSHVWIAVKDLQAGTYHYVFIINGKKEIRDPSNTSFDMSKRAHGVSAFSVQEVAPSR